MHNIFAWDIVFSDEGLTGGVNILNGVALNSSNADTTILIMLDGKPLLVVGKHNVVPEIRVPLVRENFV